jgi:hypothetical protein
MSDHCDDYEDRDYYDESDWKDDFEEAGYDYEEVSDYVSDYVSDHEDDDEDCDDHDYAYS